MPERLEKIKHLLQELESELAQLDRSDPEATELLKNASAEIDAAISDKNPSAIESDSLTHQLRDRLEDFESHHPNITALANRIADALAQLGI